MAAALRVSDVALGEMKLIDLDGIEVVVANVDGVFCAFSNICSHEEGPLAEGDLDGDIVTCPWHHSRFNVRTGEVIDGVTDDPIQIYEVRVDSDNIRVMKTGGVA